MRTIKFRAKDIWETEFFPTKWRYGGIVIDGDTAWMCVETSKQGIVSVKVNPDTVGQFTGLTDKNGKEIYEGDIIEEHDLIYEVCWYDDIAAFMAEDMESEKPFLMSDMDLTKTMVIGNIHDNPDLLTDKLNK